MVSVPFSVELRIACAVSCAVARKKRRRKIVRRFKNWIGFLYFFSGAGLAGGGTGAGVRAGFLALLAMDASISFHSWTIFSMLPMNWKTQFAGKLLNISVIV